MAIQQNPYPLRIDKTILEKVRYTAKENGRSLNKEIEFILRAHIKRYEKENGEIPVNPADTDNC